MTVEVEHIGDTVDHLAREDPREEYCCAVAKSLFFQDRLQLAWIHWTAALNGAHDEREGGRRLTARASGNLAACALRLGQPRVGLEHAQRSVELEPNERAWLRVATAALACCENSTATEAYLKGTASLRRDAPEYPRFARVKLQLRAMRNEERQRQRAFCQRALSSPAVALE